MGDTQIKVGDVVAWSLVPSGAIVSDTEGGIWMRQGDIGFCLFDGERWDSWDYMESQCDYDASWDAWRLFLPETLHRAGIIALGVDESISVGTVQAIVDAR